MKFTVDYPIVIAGYDPALVTAAGMTRVAQAVEAGGYDAISFSEHPAPSAKWLNAGGHESLDQTSALAFCAAVTRRVRLMTYLLVLPYHNPFLTAKALSTVDLLSGGRLTVVAGTGYLRSEFLALNVDMDQRNELFERVRQEEGRLDLLVNNAALIGDELQRAVPFWEKSLAASVDLLEVGLLSTLVASYYAAPLLVETGQGLVVFTSGPGAVRYQYGAAYGAHKAGLDKFAADMAVDFRPFGVTAVSIWMGAVLTERLRQIIDSGPEFGYLDDIAETPEFTGHVIAALAADPDVLAVSGRTLIGAEVALQYGISDRDGRHPPSAREWMRVAPASYQGRTQP